MNIFKTGVTFLTLLFIFSSCLFFKKGAKEDNNSTASSEKPIDFKHMTEIVFGWGGGFTGMIESYQLSKDGTLKLGTEIKKKVDSKTMKVVLAAFKKVNFAKTRLNDPGNLYYFMAIKAGNNEQRLIWNDQTELPVEVKAAYDLLIKTTIQQ